MPTAINRKRTSASCRASQSPFLPDATQTNDNSAVVIERLAHMNFESFARLIATLLTRMGYEEVQLARRQWKGRNADGGYDIFASRRASSAGAPRRQAVVVQLKQFAPTQKVYQRTLDELAGVCLRVGASQGILITTSRFSPSIELPGSASPSLRLIDGEKLVRLLSAYKIDISKGASSQSSKTALLPRTVPAADRSGSGRGMNPVCCREAEESPNLSMVVSVCFARKELR